MSGDSTGHTSMLQNFFTTRAKFLGFVAQNCAVVILAWFFGYMGFSVAWCIGLTIVVTSFWSNTIDIFIQDQIDFFFAKASQTPIDIARVESMEWINLLVDRWLRFGEPAIEEMMRSSLNPMLASFKPAFFESLEVAQFSLGSSMPRVESMTVNDLSMNPSEALVVEKVRKTLLEKSSFDLVLNFIFDYNSPDFLLQIGGKLRTLAPEQLAKNYGLGWSVNVANLKFGGRCQIGIRFDRTIPFPHMKYMWIMFLDKEPQISMSINTLHANMMALPKINEYIRTIVKTSLSDYMYYPHKYIIPMYAEPGENVLSGPTDDAAIAENGQAQRGVQVESGSVKAAGILFVTLNYGEGFETPLSQKTKAEDVLWCSIKLEGELAKH